MTRGSEPSARYLRFRRLYRPIAFALTAVTVALAAVELVYGLFGPPNWRAAVGNDLKFYADISARLFNRGYWFEERELHGPFQMDFMRDVLYPPAAAWVFLPFNVIQLGGLLLIVVGTSFWLLHQWRPAPWTWPILALCLAWPLTLLKGLAGTSSLLVMTGLGLALRYGWPGAFILLKPSFLPLGLLGIWTRGWWIAVAVFLVASLPFISDTLRYPEVLMNMRNPRGFLYSLEDLPMILMPVIAWLGRTHHKDPVIGLRGWIRRPQRPIGAVNS